ncbi:MAG: hypothetical protein HYR64_04185 [Fimbriimonas ginsengisoli]|uniref:Uncharacterized protein n=1 Tax=Fimbriimonas ginsengisoli TaxID=1005039 RepID=A0A931LS37_FIMGI|nr:hypothetical protein [Fimbriimonas ginsengisoli]
MMPAGIRLIAYSHFFVSSVLLFLLTVALLATALVTLNGQRMGIWSTKAVVSSASQFLSLKNVKTHESQQAIIVVGVWVVGILLNSFIGFRLLAGSRLGWWASLACLAALAWPFARFSLQTGVREFLWLGLPPLLAMLYLLLPKTRRLYF